MARQLEGDVFYIDGVLVHQVNCTSTYFQGLAKEVFSKFPLANPCKRKRVAGTIELVDVSRYNTPVDYVVNLYGQVNPGVAGPDDTVYQRLMHFKAALGQLMLECEERPEWEQIVFPANIGCGLAGGAWADYSEMIHEFAKTVDQKVYIIRRPM